MSRFKDITSHRFGRLVALYPSEIRYKGRMFQWVCQCDCGNTVTVLGTNLSRGNTKSCGCHRDELISNVRKTHGMSGLPEYSIWKGIRKRCYSESEPAYKNYGGRGIDMSPQWKDSFEQFYLDMGPRPSADHSVERKDNDIGYSKENCVWATRSDQSRNRRVFSRSKTGVTGVSNRYGRFQAMIRVNGVLISLGTFDTIAEAATARKAAEAKLWGATITTYQDDA